MKKLTALIILTAAVLAIASGCNKKEVNPSLFQELIY